METPNFFTAFLLFLILTLSLLGLVVFGLYYALQHVSWEAGRKNKVLLRTIAGLITWLAFTGMMAANGFFKEFQAVPPRFVILILPPLLLVVILAFSSSFTQVLSALPPAWLIYLQSFRILVEIILWLVFLDHIIPIQMTFEGRNFDILTGLTAPVIAYFCFQRKAWPPKIAIAWNILGLLLVANIVIISILSAPTPFRAFMNEPANTFIADLPFVWLPGFVVPVAYGMHIFSIRQLLSRKETSARKIKSYKMG